MKTDPIALAERAIQDAQQALERAQQALQAAKASRVTNAPRSSSAHRLAMAIAAETAPGLPLDSPVCRRVYIASFEAYNAARKAGQTPARAKLAAWQAGQGAI